MGLYKISRYDYSKNVYEKKLIFRQLSSFSTVFLLALLDYFRISLFSEIKGVYALREIHASYGLLWFPFSINMLTFKMRNAYLQTALTTN